MQDPYLQIAIQSHVQNNLAAERKQERERIAQELIERMSSKLGSTTSSRPKPEQIAHGVPPLPSDDMDKIMHNSHN